MKLSQLVNKWLYNQQFILFLKLSYTPFLIFGILSILFSQKELALIINQFNYPIFDFFFKYLTYVGDGLICIILILAFVKNRFFRLAFIISTILVLSVTYIFKYQLFPNTPRPLALFKDQPNLIHTVDGVIIFMARSFPSGHTMVAFSMLSMLAVALNKKLMTTLLYFLAFLIGFSRMYLFEHFMIDVLVGGLLGLFITYISLIISDSILLKFSMNAKNQSK